MFRSFGIILTLILLFIIGCSTGARKPGTGGKSTAIKIDKSHPDIPEGVKCYVCHKKQIPEEKFHNKFGINCEECHGKATWIAYKYPHEKWPLGIHRKMQCVRCHLKKDIYDFSAWQCWGCHHNKKETENFHKNIGHVDISNCIGCHKGFEKGKIN